MQVHVTEQRRNHPALGSPLARPTPSLRLALLTRFYDWGLQPHPDQLEHTPVHYSHAHTSQKLVPRNRIEVGFQIRVSSPWRSTPLDTRLGHARVSPPAPGAPIGPDETH